MEEYSTRWIKEVVIMRPLTGFKLGGYSESFKPEAIISIQQTAQGSNFKVVIKPRITAVAVLFLVIVLLLTGTWYSQRGNIAMGRYKDISIVATGLLILGYLLPVSAFNNDVEKLKILIADYFEVDNNSKDITSQ
ncbi:hypothetical protein [Mucilaginibacter antarcticus]|uniref:hypothetical protein n=1 Tax=Mucilaginibacter antarcticus TaxID=1855725 RepID=UPI00363FA2F1